MAFVVRPAPVGSFCQTGPSPRGFVLSNLPALGRLATGGFVLRFAVDSKLTGWVSFAPPRKLASFISPGCRLGQARSRQGPRHSSAFADRECAGAAGMASYGRFAFPANLRPPSASRSHQRRERPRLAAAMRGQHLTWPCVSSVRQNSNLRMRRIDPCDGPVKRSGADGPRPGCSPVRALREEASTAGPVIASAKIFGSAPLVVLFVN